MVTHDHSGLPTARSTSMLTGPTRTMNRRMPVRSQGSAGTAASWPVDAATTSPASSPCRTSR